MAPAITASAKRCTCAIPTKMALSCTGTVPKSNGRAMATERWRCSRTGSTSTICCDSGRGRLEVATVRSGKSHRGCPSATKQDQGRRDQLESDAAVEWQGVAPGRVTQQADNTWSERIRHLSDRGDQADQNAERARVKLALHDQGWQRDQVADRNPEQRASRYQHQLAMRIDNDRERRRLTQERD